jgi:class 3 adenylate cyclase
MRRARGWLRSSPDWCSELAGRWGDVLFPDPGPGVVAALAMVEGVTDAGLPPAHVGLHAGPVVFQEGDYYGQTVNVAARIGEYARPGEVLVSQEVVDASQDAGVSFPEIGPVELNGVSGVVGCTPLTAKRRRGRTPLDARRGPWQRCDR